MASRFTAFVMYIILLVLFLGLIDMTFDLTRYAFMGQFLILLVLLFLGMLSAMGMSKKSTWAWKLFTLFFVVVFLDMLLVYILAISQIVMFLHYLIIAIVGFFISLFNVRSKPAGRARARVKTSFKPGKFIASKTGKKFHAPKCDWAKKIKKSNAVWFNGSEEAKKAGYKADKCVN